MEHASLMLLLREYDPTWPTRYWMQNPLFLPRGSRVEVTAVLKPGASDTGAPSLLAGTGLDPSVRLLLDFVAAGQGDAAGGQQRRLISSVRRPHRIEARSQGPVMSKED